MVDSARVEVTAAGGGRAEYLVYARDAATTKAALPDAEEATIETSEDPEWAEAIALIRRLR